MDIDQIIKKYNLNVGSKDGILTTDRGELETILKEYHTEQLRIGGVSQQRELLLDFTDKVIKSPPSCLLYGKHIEFIEDYLKYNNCG